MIPEAIAKLPLKESTQGRLVINGILTEQTFRRVPVEVLKAKGFPPEQIAEIQQVRKELYG